MDSVIRLLPDNIANQIAAGEVIQRPASVVKELVENAVDAGANKIDVNIKDSGKTLIQVVDNGCGMTKEDAEMCFERHATSKLSSAEDLFALKTKGFRGEALASIAAIAHVILRTKREADELGTSISIEGSKFSEVKQDVTPNGSAFEVKNLFYNVPARRNFLKSEKVEFGHIQDEFIRVAMAHPDISFSLRHNGNDIFILAPGNLKTRIAGILGNKGQDKLVPINESTDIVELSGFVLKPEYARKTRGEQYFFVNDRFFKSSYFNHAVNKAFEGLLKEGSHSGYFLFLKVDPSKIDVNVHPTKTEIKFEEEKFIYSILLSSIRQALGKYNITPTLDFERESSFDIPYDMQQQPVVEPEIKVNPEYNPFSTGKSASSGGKKNFTKAVNQHGFGTSNPSSKDWEDFYSIDEEETAEQGALIEESLIHKTEKFLFKDPYLVTPVKSGLMLIHARRAYEQIIYADIINSFISNPIASQKLLFPLNMDLNEKEALSWKENISMLSQLGFDGELKENTLNVEAVPVVLQDENISETVYGLIETLAFKDVEKGELAHSLVSTIAASASVNIKDLNNYEAQKSLVDQLFQCENHMFTPRNKKIIETIDLDFIQSKFK